MDKLEMQTPNFTDANIEKLAGLFPNCVTEAKDAKGKLKKAIDFDLLKQELSENIVDGPRERYQINWPGKKEALVSANTPINKTLRPCREESVDFDTTENLYIEGDNLEALKLLQESYLGKIKMIYIDPPYNTGKDFVYKDNYTRSREEELEASEQINEDGGRLVANLESNGRFHSDWMSMIYPRLKIARNLLKEDGVIFLSIGEDEVHNLKKLCDEVFGENNFISTISRVMKTGGNKGRYFSPNIDYILVYTRNIVNTKEFRAKISDDLIKKVYTQVENSGDKKGEKYRTMGLYQAGLDIRPNQRYWIKCPDGSFVIPNGKSFPTNISNGSKIKPTGEDGVWKWIFSKYSIELEKNNIVFKETKTSSLLDENGNQSKWNIYNKIWLNDRLEDGRVPVNIIEKMENRHSSSELKSLNIPFDFAKPTELIKYLFEILRGDNNDILLDFFSGSSSSAHAVIKLNSEENTHRKFIMVQLPEATDKNSEAYKAGYKTIAEIGKERIRRAGKKIKEENVDKEGIEDLDIGFRVLKIDSSNMKDIYYTPDTMSQSLLDSQEQNIKEDRTAEDLLFQVLLDWGVDLTLPISREEINGKTVYFVDEDTLVACFDDDLDAEFAKEIAMRKPLRAVFKESGYKQDEDKINIDQVIKQFSPDTEVRAI